MEVAQKDTAVVVLLRFVLKLLIWSLERQVVYMVKLRNKTGCIARQ